MKKNLAPWIVVTFFFGLAAATFWGCASKPPTQFERGLFNVTTNYGEPVVVVKTNVIPYTVVQTNFLVVTNVQGVPEFRTNVIPILAYQTNTVTVTNTPEYYHYEPGAGAAAARQVGTEVGGVFGVGGLVGTAMGALFSLWGWVRSSKRTTTAINIAQTVETMREFIKQLPNGQTMDTQLVTWIQNNQANAGVLKDVINLLDNYVKNSDARVAAEEIQQTIDALSQQTVTPPPTTTPVTTTTLKV